MCHINIFDFIFMTCPFVPSRYDGNDCFGLVFSGLCSGIPASFLRHTDDGTVSCIVGTRLQREGKLLAIIRVPLQQSVGLVCLRRVGASAGLPGRGISAGSVQQPLTQKVCRTIGGNIMKVNLPPRIVLAGVVALLASNAATAFITSRVVRSHDFSH